MKGVGEVRLGLVLRSIANRLRFPAAAFLTFGFSFGLGLCTLAPFGLGLFFGLLLQTLHGFFNRLQTIFATFEFVGQLVPSTAIPAVSSGRRWTLASA